MTTTTTGLAGPRLTFPGLLRSEWIKLRSVRSTLWCYWAIILVSIGFGLLISTSQGTSTGDTTPEAMQTTVLAATASVNLTQLIAAVLGVVAISSEFGTGLIRSTFTAAPRRLDAYTAKIVVLSSVTFLVGLLSILGSTVANTPILSARGAEVGLTDAALWRSLLAAALYLALITVAAFAFGALVRRSAGGIAAILALLLIVPNAFQIAGLATHLRWLSNLAQFMPTTAGQTMFAVGPAAPPQPGMVALQPWEGLLVLLGWVVGLAVLGGWAVRRRDV